MGRLQLLLSVIVLVGASAFRAAGHGPFPSNENMRHFPSMSAPQLSPEGRRVLVELPTARLMAGVIICGWWPWDHNSSRQLTFSPAGKKDVKDRGETSGR